MPDKPLQIVTYAAGASLAAATLIYVFGPTFLLDDEASSSRKKGVVGLSNAANDCFINSVLQALAGLPDLRIYLIRETHRRKLDGPDVYEVDAERLSLEDGQVKSGKLEGLQKGIVTYALKDILDHLNERPLYRKTISPQPFIRALERAYNTRISRQQQDAQEFLQIVTERLCDEYHAGAKARRRAQASGVTTTNGDTESERQEIANQFDITVDEASVAIKEEDKDTAEGEVEPTEEGFPFEGKIESQIECLTCGFKPKPSVSTFTTLTLNVPQQSSTSLNACFDGIFKVEHIDDFKCEYCRLEHAIQFKTKELSRAATAQAKEQLQSDINKLRDALAQDPEAPPKDVELPDLKLAPPRKIARHMYISNFPKVLAVHLSRSMFAIGSVSTKNMAKVTFPEELPLGGILSQKKYKLLGMVTHKGGHNSGHYESFRRQVQPVPFSTPNSFGSEGVYSVQASPNLSAIPSAVQSPRISTSNLGSLTDRNSSSLSTPTLESPSVGSLSSHSSLPSRRRPAPTSAPYDDETFTPSSPASTSRPKSSRSLKERASASVKDLPEQLKRKTRPKAKPRSNRWWRISDDKIKESKTSEVLSMQKEVYLLFYELDRRND
jgi:ubiquitin carboxyl-terminal hydrolase 16